jgi:hypothetical protein
MRNGRMTALGAVPMRRIVTVVAKAWRAAIGVFGADFDDVLLDHVARLVVEVAIVKIVDMAAMFDGDMAAAWAMLVRMIGVNAAVIGHSRFLSWG